MANRRFIDFPIASSVGDNDIILIWQSGLNKQTTKATFLSGLPENLVELNDVAISGLTNGQILRYDSVTGKWENTDQGNLDLNDLNDVSIVSPSNGQVLVYNPSTSRWENSSGGYVPYTGAVTTVDLGAQQLKAGHTTLTTNGSTETLTINHTSGSGKAINVTKGGNNEGLYINKTSGSGNAATIVGTLEATTLVKTGGTSSQFLKADGSVDSTSYQPLLTNPVTGTGTTNYLPKFTGASTIGNSTLQEVSGNLGLGVNPSSWSQFKALEIGTIGNGISGFIGASSTVMHTNAYWNGTNWIYANTANSAQIEIQGGNIIAFKQAASGTGGNVITYTQPMTITSGGNVGIGTIIATQPLQIGNGLLTGNQYLRVFNSASDIYLGQTGVNLFGAGNGQVLATDSTYTSNFSIGTLNLSANLIFGTANIEAMRIFSGQNVHIGPTPLSDNGARLQVSGTARISGNLTLDTSSLILGLGNGGSNEAVYFNYNSNAASRSWRIIKDWTAFGDFQIQQSTTQTGTTYADILRFSPNGSATFSSTVLSTRFFNPSGPYGTQEGSARNHFTQFNAGNAGLAGGWIAGAFGDALGDRIVIGQYSGVAVIAGHSANLDAWANMSLATGGGNVLIGTITSGASKLRIVGLPTSSSGLSSGDVWNNGGTLTIV